MKIDIVALAPTLLPFVPSAYRPLAQAAIDELIAKRQKEKEMEEAIGRLHQLVNRLTQAANMQAEQTGQIIKKLREHDQKFFEIAH